MIYENRGFLTSGISTELGSVPLEASTTYQRSLIFLNGAMSQITDAQIGIGLKPLVLYQGTLQVRTGTEGVPIILDVDHLRTLRAGETLLI